MGQDTSSVRRNLTRFFNAIWYGGNPLGWLLWPFAWLYRTAVVLRRALYRRGVLHAIDPGVPVVVVGNLTVGGTGKTPCVVWLAETLEQRGLSVGIVTRGYGGKTADWPQWVTGDSDPGEVGDEPVLLAQRTGSPVAAGPDRVEAAKFLLERCKVDVLVADDGLQHYRLARRFEIAVVDGHRGLGNGLCLPAGPLREHPQRLETVDAIVVNSGGWECGDAYRARLSPVRVVRLGDGEARDLDDFTGSAVHAVAGIGHPERFFALLESAGITVDPRPLADHARIRAADLGFDDAAPVLITEKDAVKCRGFAPDNVWAVIVDLAFGDDDGARLTRLLMRRLDLEAEPE